MKLAFRWPRRMYPYHGLSTMLPQELRPQLFAWAQAAGFEGTEVSYTHVKHDQVSDDEIKGSGHARG